MIFNDHIGALVTDWGMKILGGTYASMFMGAVYGAHAGVYKLRTSWLTFRGKVIILIMNDEELEGILTRGSFKTHV